MKNAKTIALLLFASVLLSCTSYRSFERARELEQKKEWDGAVAEYTKALDVDPDNIHYKLALQRARMEASRVHFEKGKQLRAAADQTLRNGHADDALRLNETAAIEYELAVKLDPTNQFAAVEFGKVVTNLQNARTANDPNSMTEKKRRASLSKAQPPQLNPASDEPISLSFPRPTAVKDVYRALGNSFGINVIFDQSVKDEEKIAIELRDVTAQQALERVMQMANHFYKVLDEKSIIVVADTPATRRDFEDLVIRTFYLSNGKAEEVTNVLRTMLEARYIFTVPSLNAITIRDTADKVRIAEKIIEANDKAKSEVVVDVELLQVNAGKIREIGPQLTANVFGQSLNVAGADGKPTNNLTLDQIRNLGSDNWTFTVPSVLYSLIKSTSNAQLLAKPQLRISEGEKAVLHIGEKRPVPVSTLYSNISGGQNNFGPVTSFQYQDVGIKIAIEPRVHHNREVTLKLTVEVSSISGEVPGTGGTPPQPIIATRTIESVIRLKDGETNFLAGLIRKEEIESKSQIPFLSDIPIIGRIFTKDRKQHESLDVVLTMTPHIIRIPDITEDDLAPMWVGTQANITFRGVSPRLESNTAVDPFVSRRDTNPQPNPGEGEQPQDDATTPMPPRPNAPVTPGGAPSDPFRPRQIVANEAGASQSLQASASAEYQVAFTPRIAPQPATLTLKPGQDAVWSVIGMDLESLSTPALVFHFDPSKMSVLEAQIGESIAFDPATPPVVSIDTAGGTIRVASSDGSPIRFRSGGAVIALRVRGGAPGETMLVMEPAEFTKPGGGIVTASISGGRAEVQ